MTREKTAFLFPGQGSQAVGMGREAVDLPAAAAVFEQANDALGFDLTALCFEGPDEDLQLTANTQPAILTTSIALLRHLEAQGVTPSWVAGHSLGEYSALVAAGVLRFEDAVRLVRRRGELMQEAVPVGVGAMAAILGMDSDAVRKLTEQVSAEQGAVCSVANLNSPEQTVIAGHREAVERACELAPDAGAKRAVLLPVSAPFHSPLMAPAREGMAPLLEATEFRDAEVPVICNVDAKPLRDAAEIRDALIRQIDSPVRWVESMQGLVADGCRFGIEIGPGGVLMGLARRIDRSLRVFVASTPEAVAKAVQGIESTENDG